LHTFVKLEQDPMKHIMRLESLLEIISQNAQHWQKNHQQHYQMDYLI
jgi:hypothetical protein